METQIQVTIILNTIIDAFIDTCRYSRLQEYLSGKVQIVADVKPNSIF